MLLTLLCPRRRRATIVWSRLKLIKVSGWGSDTTTRTSMDADSIPLVTIVDLSSLVDGHVKDLEKHSGARSWAVIPHFYTRYPALSDMTRINLVCPYSRWRQAPVMRPASSNSDPPDRRLPSSFSKPHATLLPTIETSTLMMSSSCACG